MADKPTVYTMSDMSNLKAVLTAYLQQPAIVFGAGFFVGAFVVLTIWLAF